MTAASNYAEDNILDHMLGTSAWTMPTGSFIQLHTGDPGEDGTANVATNNTRQSATWNASSGGSATNNGVISWTSVPATETYTHWTSWDAVTAGNCIVARGTLTGGAVLSGQDFDIADAGLTVTAD